jgi:hypothetical protein
LLDACLYLVRAYLQHGDRPQARTQALECRRLVPDIAPEPTMHPPDVIGVLAEAQAELRAHEPPALRIESEPTGCAAYVNGRNLGATPKELSQLSPGEYRLQVECETGVMGRVHRVGLVRGRVVARIDTLYDRVIQTVFDLSLHYATKDEERTRMARDAVETGRIVGATDVVVARASGLLTGGKSEVWLVRYRVSDGVELARTRITFDPAAMLLPAAELSRARKELTELSAEQLARAAAAASKREAEPESAAVPVDPELAEAAVEPAAEPSVEAYPEAEAEGPSALHIAGYVIGGVGLATQIASFVLYGRHLSLQSDYTAAVNANEMPMAVMSDVNRGLSRSGR